MSNIVNKVKDAIHSHKDKDSTTDSGFGSSGTTSGTTHHDRQGPHSSDTANKIDPRVDSDRDNSRTVGGTQGGFGSTTHGTSTTHHREGEHSSDWANKADPRIDSDRDGSRTVGSGTQGDYGSSTTQGGFTSSGFGTREGFGSSDDTTAHRSEFANKIDPRVDSDRVGGTHAQAGGATGIRGGQRAGEYDSTTGAGGYSTQDSTDYQRGGRDDALGRDQFQSGGEYGSNTTRSQGFGGQQDTYGSSRDDPSNVGNPRSDKAGPHASSALNALDPRVDSDLDGSRTLGSEKTYDQGGAGQGRDSGRNF